MYCIEHNYHDGRPMLVEYNGILGVRLQLATFETLEAARSALAQLEGYAAAQDECAVVIEENKS
jgi:hypothetical protein